MNPLIIIGLGIAAFAAWQQSQKKSEPGTGTGSTDDGTKPKEGDAKPVAGESSESTTTDGKTVVVTTVDGTAKVEPTTDKQSGSSMAGAAERGFDAGVAKTGTQTAPSPKVAGAAVRAGTGAIVGVIPNPFAKVGAAAYSGLVTSTIDNTSRREATVQLKRLGPAVGAMW